MIEATFLQANSLGSCKQNKTKQPIFSSEGNAPSELIISSKVPFLHDSTTPTLPHSQHGNMCRPHKIVSKLFRGHTFSSEPLGEAYVAHPERLHFLAPGFSCLEQPVSPVSRGQMPCLLHTPSMSLSLFPVSFSPLLSSSAKIQNAYIHTYINK